jgi:hypothetical protein
VGGILLITSSIVVTLYSGSSGFGENVESEGGGGGGGGGGSFRDVEDNMFNSFFLINFIKWFFYKNLKNIIQYPPNISVDDENNTYEKDTIINYLQQRLYPK